MVKIKLEGNLCKKNVDVKSLWKHYYAHVNAMIFVVDSNDVERIPEAREELHKMLSDEQLKNTIVLILGNKQDLPNALRADELRDQLDLNGLKQKKL